MTLSAAPHPMAVMRVLKQAYRDYAGGGGAQTLTVAVVPTHAASAPTVVTGTVVVDLSVPPPVAVLVQLNQSGVKGSQTAYADPVTGAWTATFAGGLLVAGTATATADTDYATPVTTPAFTLT